MFKLSLVFSNVHLVEDVPYNLQLRLDVTQETAPCLASAVLPIVIIKVLLRNTDSLPASTDKPVKRRVKSTGTRSLNSFISDILYKT